MGRLLEGGAVTTLIPGHGSIALGRESVLQRLRGDLAYLERLAAGVAQARDEGLSLEAARERLADLEYPSRGAHDAGLAEHLENVEFAWRGLAGAIERG